MTNLLVIQHHDDEPIGAYGRFLQHRGVGFDVIRPYRGDPMPRWQAYAGMVVMGGPMGATEDACHPWLTLERSLIAEAVTSGFPYWGVCLGAQLLAASVGGHVYRRPSPEVGHGDVRTEPDARRDPVFGTSPSSFAVLHWHDDTFTMPPGAKLLATSDDYPQAFVYNNAYGIQFHLELDEALLTLWTRIPEYAASLRQTRGVEGLEELSGRRRALPVAVWHATAERLFGRWIDLMIRCPPLPGRVGGGA